MTNNHDPGSAVDEGGDLLRPPADWSTGVDNPDGLAVRHEVLTYITSDDWLLVFRHVDFPEAGFQVPAGTVEPGEDPGVAVLREAREETGLTLAGYPGRQNRDMRDFDRPELHLRHVFHLTCDEARRSAWRHDERSSAGGGQPIRFELFWARLPDHVTPLIADQDALLPQLLARLCLPPSLMPES